MAGVLDPHLARASALSPGLTGDVAVRVVGLGQALVTVPPGTTARAGYEADDESVPLSALSPLPPEPQLPCPELAVVLSALKLEVSVTTTREPSAFVTCTS